MGERWETVEELGAARRRFEAAIPGWQPPTAYGFGRLVDGRLDLVRVNTPAHPLPGVVLALVCGHRSGSASYRLDAAGLGRTIELLAPAEACTAVEHPNLAALRQLHAELGDGDELVVVFAGDPQEPCDDPHVAALRERVA